MTAIDKVRTWCGIGTAEQAILELSDTITALTERVKELEEASVREWLDARKLPFDTGPILNDGKAEPDLSQRPPFVTGLSVLDSLKK